MATQDPDKKAAEKAEKAAAKEKDKADAAAAKQAAAAQKQAEKLASEGLSDDIEYRKALNDMDGLTLVPAKKVKKNHTVEQVSDKVYPGGMVIAKRL